MRRLRLASRYAVAGSASRKLKTLSGLKPAFTSCNFQNAFTIRPEPIRRTRASASSAVTRTARNRLAVAAPVARPAADFSVSCSVLGRVCTIGASPKTIPVATETPSVNSSTCQSIPISRDARDAAGIGRDQETQAAERQQHPESSAGKGQHNALYHELLQQLSHAGADCGAHRDLLAPGFRTRQKQVGDIHARNQQNENHGSQQDQHRAPDALHHFILESGEHDRVVLVVEGVPALAYGVRGLLVRSEAISAWACASVTPVFRRPSTERK